LAAEYWKNREDGNNGPHYFIHYKGWKQSWDEWLPETRVFKYAEENLRHAESLKSSYLKARKTSLGSPFSDTNAAENKVSLTSSTNSPSDEKSRKRIKSDGSTKIDSTDESVKEPEMILQIPHSLKLQLVDDWEYITKQQRVRFMQTL
jgi:mortality factor 4-like protein 1